MKRILLPLFLLFAHFSIAQLNLDTLAIQDFELVPQSPVWTFTGPVIYNSGFSSGTAAPANSPIGIGGSRAWETTTNSGGLVLNFDNITIPAGYDSVRVHFNLAAMNLVGSSGGPDNLDYVLIAYSTDAGVTFTNRMRIRGAVADNSFWAYSATGVAKVFYTPATESLFQPLTTGLQTTLGYSNCEIVFPGSVTQVQMRITGRSSSSTDTWLVDNLLITGENNCVASSATISPTACGSYLSPSGNNTWTTSGTYQDTIPNFTGCDSAITVNLTVLTNSTASISPVACNSYTSPSGNQTWTASGTYMDTIPNTSGCDSLLTINLTINGNTGGSLTGTYCDSLLSPSGNHVWTMPGLFYDTIPNIAGCDSIIVANIVILQSSNSTITAADCDSYTAPSGAVLTTSGTYTDVIPNAAGCDSVITIMLTLTTPNVAVTQTGNTLTATAAGLQYQWVDCNNGFAPIGGETGQSFTPFISGNYAVLITENGCTDTSGCTLVSVLSLSENPTNAAISLFPNPATEIIILQTHGSDRLEEYAIYDMAGRLQLKGSILESTTPIDLSKLASGMYFLQAGNGELQRITFVKQ